MEQCNTYKPWHDKTTGIACPYLGAVPQKLSDRINPEDLHKVLDVFAKRYFQPPIAKYTFSYFLQLSRFSTSNFDYPELYLKGTVDFPEESDSWQSLGVYYKEEERYEEALEYYEEAWNCGEMDEDQETIERLRRAIEQEK